jgi:choline dehydrogenase
LARLIPGARIALVESGGQAEGPSSAAIAQPASWPHTLQGPSDRGYRTAPQKQLNNRKLDYARGIGVGGSSLLNVMLYTRGFKEDWDKMPEGWHSADVEREFEWLEEQLALSTVETTYYGQLVRKAAHHMGIGDSNSGGWTSHGTTQGGYQATIDASGKRVDIYRAFGADHSAVHLVQGAAEKVLFATTSNDAPSAEAVQLRKDDGTTETIRIAAGGEIILCCGTIDTPKLLQLSGVGPADLLTALRIPVVRSLAGVGQGLKDHPLLPLGFWYTGPLKSTDLSPNSIAGWLHDERDGVQILWVDGRSAAAIMPSALVAPWRRGKRSGSGCSAVVGNLFDSVVLGVMVLVSEVLRLLLYCIPLFRSQFDRVIGLNVALVRPVSSGTVMISSADPSTPPSIDPALLSDEKDLRAMLKGVATARRLVGSPPLASAVGLELLPGLLFGGDNDLVHVRANTSTYYHPTGTCAMGTCVDAQTLRLHGVNGLRVADASVLPLHPRGPTAAACMLVGARCASLLAKERG